MLKNKTIILFCLLCFSCLTRFDNDLKKTSSLKFDIDQLVINEDKSELSLNLEIPINKLVFSKKNDGFYSQITIDVFILDENKKNLMHVRGMRIFNGIILKIQKIKSHI